MRKIGAFIATLFLVCLAGPVQAIPTMTDVTGSLSKAENTCVSPIALFTSDPPQSCNYSGGEDVNILVGQLNVRNWMGPLDSGGFYAPGTGPDPLTTSGSAPGDGKVNLVITGTITIEDNQTSGAGNGGDDTISGTLLIGAGERSVSTSGGSALESFTSITHTIPSKLVDSAVDNAMGGYDYVIGSAGFPLLLSSVTGDYPSESASIATGAPSPPDINVWDTLNGGNIAVQNPFPLPLTPPGGPYTVEIVTYAPSGGVPGPNKGVATTAVMTGATCLAGDGAGLPLTDCDPDPAVGAAATWSVSGAEFDNLILKLSTNADGKVVTADAFYVLEYIIPGLGANSPNADSFIGGTLTFAGNTAAADDSATTPQDTAVDIDILTNDFNFADSVTLATQGVTAGASVTINGINPGPQAGINVTYLPPAGFAGQDTFDYTIDDGTSMDMATVTVTVTSSGGGGNLFPIAPDTGISTGESQVLDINVATLPGVNLGNTPVTITVSNGPASGTATIFGSIITYTQKGFPASDVFDYTITDADGDSATGTIFVPSVRRWIRRPTMTPPRPIRIHS